MIQAYDTFLNLLSSMYRFRFARQENERTMQPRATGRKFHVLHTLTLVLHNTTQTQAVHNIHLPFLPHV